MSCSAINKHSAGPQQVLANLLIGYHMLTILSSYFLWNRKTLRERKPKAELNISVYFSGYESETFTGAANLIANNIKDAVNELSNLAEEITSVQTQKDTKSANTVKRYIIKGKRLSKRTLPLIVCRSQARLLAQYNASIFAISPRVMLPRGLSVLS